MAGDKMTVNEILSAVLVMLCLAGIYFLILRGMRKNGYAAKTIRGLGSYIVPDKAGRLSGGIVSAAAVASLLGLFSSIEDISIVMAAGIIGMVAAIMPSGRPLNMAFSFFGGCGIAGIVWGFFTDADCTGVPLVERVTMLTILLFATLLGAVLSILKGRPGQADTLAAFAILEILIFLGTPFGVPLFFHGGVNALVPFAVAGLLGFFGSLMPSIVISLGAVAVTLTTFAFTAQYGTMCAEGPEPAPLLALAAFAVFFAVSLRLTGGRRKK